MNEVIMNHDEGIKIVEKIFNQVILKGTAIVKTDKEKAILLDALNLMKEFIESEKRRQEVEIRWNNFNKTSPKKN